MSLTPASRNQETTSEAMWEGAVSGLLTLAPSVGAVYIALKTSPTFVKRTNWQSRTALVIMPALFVFAYTAEHKLSHRMREIASETEHQQATVEWAERRAAQLRQTRENMSAQEAEVYLTRLYQQSVEDSGVRVVPGDQLSMHHQVANYIASNPMKVLGALALPSVAWIFYGRSGKEHLDFSVKLLHTRVFGQFATISLLLSVMGFKEFMDRNGKFITQAEADQRVADLKEIRTALLDRLAIEKEHRKEIERQLEEAHKQDIKDKKSHHKKDKKAERGVALNH